jgi:hypothetical protein
VEKRRKAMQLRKAVPAAVSSLLLGMLLSVPSLRVGESDQLTKFQFTFAKPMQVPGQVLQPGTYWFEIKDAQGAQNDEEKNIIAVYNQDKSKHIADIPACPIQRKSTGYGTAPAPDAENIELQIAPGTGNEPATLLAWFYPGTFTGHQFVYPDRVQSRLDEEHSQKVTLKGKRGHDGEYIATVE